MAASTWVSPNEGENIWSMEVHASDLRLFGARFAIFVTAGQAGCGLISFVLLVESAVE